MRVLRIETNNTNNLNIIKTQFDKTKKECSNEHSLLLDKIFLINNIKSGIGS